ncbi:hypothetical protein [Ornithinibacillus xuwenensis]|uniref:Uncharacterized protein n=1 Tax=Ornithinibacillus xuwenensis TaxID=3144668 RepID=A0ABU9XHQ9_9BACI
MWFWIVLIIVILIFLEEGLYYLSNHLAFRKQAKDQEKNGIIKKFFRRSRRNEHIEH